MEKRTVEMKSKARKAFKAAGMTDPMIDDVTRQLDDGLAHAAKRISQIDAQAAKLAEERAHWVEKLAGYQASLDATHDITIETISEEAAPDAEPPKEEASGQQT